MQRCSTGLGDKGSIKCTALDADLISLLLLKNGIAGAGVLMPSASVGHVVAMLLVAATEASNLTDPTLCLNSAPTADIPLIVPTALRLEQMGKESQLALMVQNGSARLGVVIANPHELADALVAATRYRVVPYRES